MLNILILQKMQNQITSDGGWIERLPESLTVLVITGELRRHIGTQCRYQHCMTRANGNHTHRTGLHVNTRLTTGPLVRYERAKRHLLLATVSGECVKMHGGAAICRLKLLYYAVWRADIVSSLTFHLLVSLCTEL